ncbi:GNAT family N-acetyltransferase [Halocatena marina]|uniref:GNAT family N-acetyltransferase n=1 Tax=Halocatena marina TaxID=2934937 RepID=A0ABD5YTQ2_9EURY|nr:GNAT family N-acetyltransferase [Halocatena marina]
MLLSVAFTNRCLLGIDMGFGRLWQLTRNEYGRTIYEALAKLGVKVSLMYVYARSVDDVSDSAVRDGDKSLTFETRRGSDIDRSDEAFEELDATDIAVLARSGETIVGQVFLSVSRPVYADPVEMDVGTEAAYIWRLHVDQEHRQRGIGTTLVDRACQAAATEDTASSVTALVALDNVPSRRLFETNGFEPRSLITYGRFFGVSYRSQRAVSDSSNRNHWISNVYK